MSGRERGGAGEAAYRWLLLLVAGIGGKGHPTAPVRIQAAQRVRCPGGVMAGGRAVVSCVLLQGGWGRGAARRRWKAPDGGQKKRGNNSRRKRAGR